MATEKNPNIFTFKDEDGNEVRTAAGSPVHKAHERRGKASAKSAAKTPSAQSGETTKK